MTIKTSKERAAFRDTAAWRTFRGYMLASKNHTCEFCGMYYKNTAKLNVHHLYDTQYDNLAVTRFMLVCRECHDYIHKKYNSPSLRSKRLARRIDEDSTSL